VVATVALVVISFSGCSKTDAADGCKIADA
jgi:hypothetical protein